MCVRVHLRCQTKLRGNSVCGYVCTLVSGRILRLRLIVSTALLLFYISRLTLLVTYNTPFSCLSFSCPSLLAFLPCFTDLVVICNPPPRMIGVTRMYAVQSITVGADGIVGTKYSRSLPLLHHYGALVLRYSSITVPPGMVLHHAPQCYCVRSARIINRTAYGSACVGTAYSWATII